METIGVEIEPISYSAGFKDEGKQATLEEKEEYMWIMLTVKQKGGKIVMT